MSMGVALVLDQSQLAHPRIGLAQAHAELFSQAHQPFARPVEQLGVGRKHHRLRLHSHRKSPAPSARARGITACDSRESSNSICKEIALQGPKTGKFDYLSGPNHSAHSIAFKFFTDDYFSAIGRRAAYSSQER